MLLSQKHEWLHTPAPFYGRILMTGTGGGQSAFSQVFVQNINTEYRSIIPYRHGNLQSVNCPASGKDMRRLSLPDLSIKTLRSAGFHAMINMYKYTFFCLSDFHVFIV